jgi:hypothetical protein
VRLLTVFDTETTLAPDADHHRGAAAYQPGRRGFWPRDLPQAITTRLHDEIVRILKSPDPWMFSRRTGLR